MRRALTLPACGLLALFCLSGLASRPAAALPAFADVRRDYVPSDATLLARDGQVLQRLRIDKNVRRLAWTPLAEISPALVRAVIVSEDKRFMEHDGVDWRAAGNAAWGNFWGKRTRGASTLTMQLVGLLDEDGQRRGRRSFLAKLSQTAAAIRLETAWSKRQIVEAYLNLVPFRGELQGVGAMSQQLFGKWPHGLDERESALAAALLRSPNAQSDLVARRACNLLREMAREGECPSLPGFARTALSGSARMQDDGTPQRAPHLARKLLDTPGQALRSSLDYSLQGFARESLRRHLGSLRQQNAEDGAVVVLDNAAGEVLAYVGGVGLKSTAASVDGANARRQAGSTLKPHLYAQVIEHGWLTAASILDDSPVQLDTASGLYVPKNYDHSFKGPVSVRHALASSLNVPAVRALVIDDVQQFRDRLWALGYHGLVEDGEYYGFSLALGSAEVSLVEQANAFRTLANQGRWSPVRFREGEKPEESRRIVSAPAAFIVGDILADASARADAFGADSALRLPFWAAAKTGTSKGMRDNWCIGFTDRYTVAVWVGNLEGDSMRAVSGTSGAAPVWRDVMLALHASSPGKAPAMPAGVEVRQISLPGTREPPRREYFLTGTAQSELAAAPQAARRPRITSPVSGSVYALDPDIPLDRQRLGIAVSGQVAGYRLILDKQVLGDADAGQQILPRPGSHMLTLVDPGGKPIDRVRFTVR